MIARPEPPHTRYWLTRFLLLRALGCIYFVAFLSLVCQVGPLIGERGILPVGLFLERLLATSGGSHLHAFLRLPTLFLLDHSDRVMTVAAWLGLALSLSLAAGLANAPLLFALWAIYLSFVHVGQLFYAYGWEIMLLEAGFLAIFLAPLINAKPFPEKSPPPSLLMWCYRWMLFRVMFGAGLIKLRGDPCWTDLTCLRYHFETQPIPNPVSWYFHQLPEAVLKFGVLFNHLVELVAPFMILGPRRMRILGGILMVSFQLILIVSGNLSFLNWLTLAICIPCFDDQALRHLLPGRWRHRLAALGEHSQIQKGRRILLLCLGGLILLLSVQPVLNMLSPRQIMNTSFNPLHLVNTYGAFGHVGKIRHEVILLGTDEAVLTPSTRWREYEFVAKPGSLGRRPPIIAPYQPRIDWQIWFAAMSDYTRQPWLVHFVYQLLQGNPGAARLLANNPFPQKPPSFIRADLYAYWFTTFAEKRKSGNWWKRKRLGAYLPPLSRDNPSLLRYLAQYGWVRKR